MSISAFSSANVNITGLERAQQVGALGLVEDLYHAGHNCLPHQDSDILSCPLCHLHTRGTRRHAKNIEVVLLVLFDHICVKIVSSY